jgi:uncharacterized protein (DUF1330 family)
MSTYVLVETRVFNKDAFQRYRDLAKPSLQAFGAHFVARGRVVEPLEGDKEAESVALIEFASEEAAREWYSSAPYQQAIAAREGVASMNLTLLAG